MIKYLLLIALSSATALAQVRGTVPFNTNDLSIPIVGLKQTNAVLWATNLGGLVQASGAGASQTLRELTNIVGEVLSVRSYGLDHTGVTNINSALDTLQKSVPVGASVFVPRGTYKYRAMTLTNPISFYGNGDAIFKADNNVEGPLRINVTGDRVLTIKGLIFDGNRAGQNADATNWFGSLNVHVYGHSKAYIHNNTFTNYVMEGLGGTIYSNGMVYAYLNVFHNGSAHGDTLGLQTSAGRFNVAATNARPHFDITKNIIWQDTLHATEGRDPGGFIIHGADAVNVFPSLVYADNYHYQIGQNWPLPTGNHIGAVDLYDDFENAIIKNNIFRRCRYVEIKQQNSGNTIIDGNIHDSQGLNQVGFNIWVNPVERTQTNRYSHTTVVNNQIVDGGDSIGIFAIAILDSLAETHSQKIFIKNNVISNSWKGIEIEAMSNMVEVTGNNIFVRRDSMAGGRGIEFSKISDTLIIKDNTIRAYNGVVGIEGTQSNSLANVTLEGNDIESDTAGAYPVAIWGVNSLRIKSGRYKVPSGGADKVLYIDADDFGNNVGLFEYDAFKNNIESTAQFGVDYTDIDLAEGFLYRPATPEGTIIANLGAWCLISDGKLYQKRSSAGTSTGWSQFSAFVDWDSSLEIDNNVTDDTGSGALVFATMPQFTTGIGINTPAVANVALKYLVTADAAAQASMQNSSSGTSASMSDVWLNDAGHYLNVGILGSGFPTYGNFGFIQSSPTGLGIRYNTLNAGGIHAFDISSVRKLVINSSGVNIPNGTAYGAGWISSTNLANEGEIYSALQNFQPLDSDLTTVSGTNPGNNFYYGTDGTGVKGFYAFPATNTVVYHTTLAASDLTTALTAGGNKAYWRAPTNITLVDIRASLLTASSAGNVVVDVHATGVTLMTTDKLTIEASETSTETATTQPALTDTSLSNDELVVVEIDSEGANAAGLQVRLYYTIP